MIESLDFLRELNMVSVLFRLTLAMFLGGLIGLERGSKRRAAGFRTYMLVSLGAALTMLLSQYYYVMQQTAWAALAAEVGVKMDMSRFGAQVINGIGFLGAGTIIVTKRQQAKGLTTAAGLWASACMGLATGAGFFECVLLAFLLIFLSMRLLPWLETVVVEKARNMNIYVEFTSLDNVGEIISCIKSLDAHILDVDIDRGRDDTSRHPSAVFSIRLTHRIPHPQILSVLSGLECVYIIEET